MKSKPAPLYTIQSSGKKQDPLKIVLSTCRVAYCKDIKKKIQSQPKFDWKMYEEEENEEQEI